MSGGKQKEKMYSTFKTEFQRSIQPVLYVSSHGKYHKVWEYILIMTPVSPEV